LEGVDAEEKLGLFTVWLGKECAECEWQCKNFEKAMAEDLCTILWCARMVGIGKIQGMW